MTLKYLRYVFHLPWTRIPEALSSCQAAENAWPVALALSLRRMAPRLLAPLLDACAVEVVWEEALAVLQGANKPTAGKDESILTDLK